MVMLPAVTSVPGRPISAWASVLLPEPFGPMITCTSPLRTVEVDAVQHLPAARRRVQAADLEDVLGTHGSTTETVPSSTSTS